MFDRDRRSSETAIFDVINTINRFKHGADSGIVTEGMFNAIVHVIDYPQRGIELSEDFHKQQPRRLVAFFVPIEAQREVTKGSDQLETMNFIELILMATRDGCGIEFVYDGEHIVFDPEDVMPVFFMCGFFAERANFDAVLQGNYEEVLLPNRVANTPTLGQRIIDRMRNALGR
jgi:hypothetical protein